MITKHYFKRFAAVLLVFSNLFSLSAIAAKNPTRDLWTDSDLKSVYRLQTSNLPNKYRALSLDFSSMRERLMNVSAANRSTGKAASSFIELPLPDGSYEQFRLIETQMMEDELAAKYPEIKTFTGISITDPSRVAKIDIGYLGFHAMILGNNDRVFIDPVNIYSKEMYISYNRSDAKRIGTFTCYAKDSEEFLQETKERIENYYASKANLAPVQLRKYRLALACTGEYAATKGSTKTGAMSGMVASMNRVNGVYETEFAVTMIMVAKNDTLIFLNGTTDPYDNSNGGNMLSQNQSTCNSRIGSGNYDIGHVFSTGGGGIASYGSVCSATRKGQGVTGSPSPGGDSFDIDYVAHEMGHQFGGSHTFNSESGSCGGGNRVGGVAFEPGSGVTIMGYAGICGSDDLDAHSIPYFHAGSLDEMGSFIAGSGNSCAVKVTTTNNAPIVDAGTDYTIPANTPFILTGSAVDPEGQGVTYSWEEMDLGPAGTVNNPTGNAPIFRSFTPTTSPSRMFPKLSDVLNNTQTLGERKPTTTRAMNFRLTARDNQSMAGATGKDNMIVNVTAAAGPFAITSQNTTTSLQAGDSVTITWSVAGTTASPVSCANVDIKLSTDQGQSFPIILAANTPNDGSEKVLVPANNTTTGRIMVQGSGNIFFDINNANISIVDPTAGFQLKAASPALNACDGDTATVSFNITGLAGFSSPVALSLTNVPMGATATFTEDTVTPGNTTTLNIEVAGMPMGNYTLQVNANSGAFNQVQTVKFSVSDSITTPVTLLFPYDGVQKASSNQTLSWNNIPGISSYRVQISTDQTFTTIDVNTVVNAITYTPSPVLSANTTYFWRIAGVYNCGETPFSEVRSFKTNGAPASPTNLSIDSVKTDRAFISWTDNSDNEVSFKLERSANGTNFSQVALLEGNVTKYTNTGLTPGTKYWYRVRAVNSININSGYSNVDTATTLPLAGISKNTFNGDLNVYPNPGEGQYYVELSGIDKGNVRVIILDELGRTIKEIQTAKTSDKLLFELNLKEEPKGIYFVKIEAGDSQTMKKLIKY